MSKLIDKLKSGETIIGVIVAFAVIILKYSAISSLIILPQDFFVYAGHLSSFGVIILIIILILSSKQILRISHKLLVASVLGMAILGVFVATNFVQKSGHSVGQAACTNENEAIFFIPTTPSIELNALIEPHISLENAWCESDDFRRLRTLAKRESASMRTQLTFQLLIAELLLAAALTLGIWAVVLKEE